jgi:hypothetical protein
MKDKLEQIQFTDRKLLPLFSIKSVQDYATQVSLNSCKKNKTLIQSLNKLLPEIKKTFPVKKFNLHKTDNKILSYTQAYAILKICLNICNIPYETFIKNKISYVRLSQKNFILENYIKTHLMSDIREIHELSIKKPELEQVLYAELVSGIKKEYTRDYYFPISKLCNKNKNTRICINGGRLLLKHLKNLTLFIKRNEIQKTCERLFYGVQYKVLIGGQCMHTSILEKDKNLLPINPIYPFNLLAFHDVQIDIFCEQKHIEFLREFGQCEIGLCITHVELTKAVENKINKRNKQISIYVPFPTPDMKENYLVFSNGMATLKFDEWNSSATMQATKKEDLMHEIEGAEFQTEKYKCYRVADGDYEKDDAMQLLKVIAYGYDIATQQFNNIPLKTQYYVRENNVCIFRHVFLRICDAISSISIKLPYPDLIIKNLKIIEYGGYIDKTTNYLEQREIICPFHYDLKTESFVIDLSKNHYLPMAPYGTELIFSVEDCSNYTSEIIENTKLSYDYLFATCNNGLRQQIIHQIDDFIL